MIKEKNWTEFRDSGLLWFVNQTLHLFGWALVYDTETGAVTPYKCKFRGFTEEINTEGYKKVTKHLQENIEELVEESKE